jgi:hypothetical protein
LLAIPCAVVAFKAFQRKSYWIYLAAMGGIAFALFVGGAVFILITRSGTDMYANTVSPLARLSVLLHSASNADNSLPIALLSLLILLLGSLLATQKITNGTRETVRQTVFWFSVLLALYCSQLVFYNGVWPLGNRYDFPGILYIPVSIYLLYRLADRTLSVKIGGLLPKYVLRTILVCVLSLTVLAKGYASTTRLLDAIVSDTTKFTNGLSKASSLLKENRDYALVIESSDVWDYEPVYSYSRFFRGFGVENPIFLRTHCYTPETYTADLAGVVATRLADISKNGNTIFSPLAQLEQYEDRCYSLNLVDSTFTTCSLFNRVPVACQFDE